MRLDGTSSAFVASILCYITQPMPSRRSTVLKPRASARDSSRAMREAESNLAPRLTALESAIQELRQTLDVQHKRITAIQAHLDHLSSRLS